MATNQRALLEVLKYVVEALIFRTTSEGDSVLHVTAVGSTKSGHIEKYWIEQLRRDAHAKRRRSLGIVRTVVY